MTTKTNNRKVGDLYARLKPVELVRLIARFAREHNNAEMNRLRDAIPMEQAETYNRAIALLRVLNGNARDWIGIQHLGMQRDRVRLQRAVTDNAHRWLTHSRLHSIWKLIAYPVTESEYRAIVERERSEPKSLDGYAEQLTDWNGTEPSLHPDVAALLQGLPSELQRIPSDAPPGERPSEECWHEDVRRSHEIAAQIRRIITAAIKRGELPKPKRHDGELCLPTGVLSDWGEGTTPETYEPFGPGFTVPGLGQLFMADSAKWEIRPDSEAETVTERRRQLLDVLLDLAGVSRTERDALPSIDPPQTPAEWKQADELAERLFDEWFDRTDTAAMAIAAATAHLIHRSQLDALAGAITAIQRDEFGGEDPLWPEVREALTEALVEAERFDAEWESANETMRTALRRVMGFDPYPKHDLSAPAPLPTLSEELDADGTVSLIHSWAGLA